MNTPKREDEIKFLDLLKNPLRLFGWIFPLFIIIVLLLGIFYIKNLNQISFNEQTVGVTDTINVKKEILMKKGGLMPAVDLTQIKTPSPEFIANGKKLYDANCKSCHGDNGMGDGTAGAMLNPKPRNFHATEGWTNGRTIDGMYKTLQEGIIKNGMAAYEYLHPSDRLAIIFFIRIFATYPEIKDEEIASLDQTYQLSKGIVVPNQIPVEKAKLRLEEEYLTLAEKIEAAAKKLSAENNSNAVFLSKVILNKKKVLSSFLNSMVNSSMDKFINLVTVNPIHYGFKPTVAQLSKVELVHIYEYLKTMVM